MRGSGRRIDVMEEGSCIIVMEIIMMVLSKRECAMDKAPILLTTRMFYPANGRTTSWMEKVLWKHKLILMKER